MNRIGSLSIFLVFLAFYPGGAQAWLRPCYADATVVERSELIVVAHIKVGSVEYIPREATQAEHAGWVHHATLTITEVLKGQCDNEEIPIIIHFGLTPIVEGYARGQKYWITYGAPERTFPKDIIEIYDTGNSASGGPPLVKDAKEDNLWFLRRLKGIYGREPGSGNYGITDPEDLRSLKLKEYFLLYLTDNPEAAVKEYASNHPEMAGVIQNYLDHLEVQRIMQINDLEERFNRLLPYFLNQIRWGHEFEAQNGILTCGDIVEKGLKPIYEDPQYIGFRNDIMWIWRRMGFVESPIKSVWIENTGGDKSILHETGTGSADTKD